jgi:hypothetical protein
MKIRPAKFQHTWKKRGAMLRGIGNNIRRAAVANRCPSFENVFTRKVRSNHFF